MLPLCLRVLDPHHTTDLATAQLVSLEVFAAEREIEHADVHLAVANLVDNVPARERPDVEADSRPAARKRWMAAGISELVRVAELAIAILPEYPPRSSAARLSIEFRLPNMRSISGNKASASGVQCSRPLIRMNRGRPIRPSRSCSILVIAGCDTLSVRAAPETLPVFITARNTSR